MELMEQRQKEQVKQLEQILQNQEKQEKYIDRLGDLYENLCKQQTAFNQQYTDKMANIETQLESLLVNIIPPPPFDATKRSFAACLSCFALLMMPQKGRRKKNFYYF